jgi:proline iminopeptidase
VSAALQQYLAFRRSLPPRPPLERLTVRARGLDFAVYRTPSVHGALPLLCINGGLLFGHELLWPALASLTQHRQLIFYDQRGRGATTVPPGIHASRITFDGDDVPAIRKALDVAQWDVLGHSWGGGIAMLAAASDQAAIRRLVLVCAVGVTGEWLPGLHDAALARLPEAPRHALAAFDPSRLRDPDLAYHAAYTKAFFPAYFADASFAAAVTPPTGTSQTGAAVAARLRRDGYDWTDRVRDVRTPTLVVHGGADILPTDLGAMTARTLPNAMLLTLPGVGHNPFWEAPAAFFADVDAFLRAEPPP